MSDGDTTEGADPYLWLEEVDGEQATEWVRACNARTTATLATGDRFDELLTEVRQVLDDARRIPFPVWRGERLYNFWQDEHHPRGIWRRTTMDSYRRDEPEWEVLLDVDALAATEGENWVWQGATALRPENQRYLVLLSRGGADACVVREFDLVTGFVEDGFILPEAKTNVSWIDADTIFVATDFGPGSLTESGYARIAKRWRRGTPLAEAETVFEGRDEDMIIVAEHDQTPEFPRSLVTRQVEFFSSETYLVNADGALVRIEVPDDADIDVHREWLLIRLRSPWTVGTTVHPAGSLLVATLDDYLAGGRDLTVLFEPTPTVALSYHAWTRHHLILGTLRDVASELFVLDPADTWRRTPLAGVPEFSHATVIDTNPDLTDEFMLSSTGFTEPTTLRHGVIGGEVSVLKQQPAFFDAADLSVRQHFATSADGTRVPYFVVGRAGAGPGPTLLTAYGGFEIPLTPGYDPSTGRAWLARGGTYVVANIRGGGEYGPDWHRAAMRANRPRAYEDLAAVAEDLVARGVTTPHQLGVEGGSNGGLLVGVMLTRYPHLFGAVVGMVPLLDMRRYHLLLAGASWVAEYGDPDSDDWDFLRAYSPYQNVHSGQKYPPVLWMTSTRDDRVHPGHARKMTALLSEHGYDVTYYENVEGGHGAAADNAQRAFLQALAAEFLWRTLAPDS